MSDRPQRPPANRSVRRTAQWTALLLGCAAGSARASFLSGDTLDSVANALAWLVIVLVPFIAVVVIWMVHVLPEKIAHKRHHPQTQAITTLCLLSLVFGGMLWPFAWLWAYTRPIGYKLAYGTERADHYFVELAERARAGEAAPEEIERAKADLDAMQARGNLHSPLYELREEFAKLASEAHRTGRPASTAPDTEHELRSV
jgi:hypothetical protein